MRGTHHLLFRWLFLGIQFFITSHFPKESLRVHRKVIYLQKQWIHLRFLDQMCYSIESTEHLHFKTILFVLPLPPLKWGEKLARVVFRHFFSPDSIVTTVFGYLRCKKHSGSASTPFQWTTFSEKSGMRRQENFFMDPFLFLAKAGVVF